MESHDPAVAIPASAPHGLSRRRLLARAAFSATGVLLAPSAGRMRVRRLSAQPRRGGTLVMAQLGTDARSFHLGQTTDSVSATYQDYVFGGGNLLRYNPDSLEVEGHAAAGWEPSADGASVVFTLKDIRWSDGTPMTSDDYVWTYQQLTTPEHGYPYTTNLSRIASYVALDDRTLRVTLKEPTPILESWDVVTPLPRHVWEQYDWSDPARNPEILHPSVGNGMWKLQEWQPGERATFVANDLYLDGRPYIDQLTVRVFTSEVAAFQALRVGAVDYHAGLSFDSYRAARASSNVQVYEWYSARGSWSYIGFNFRRPALQDARVRRAIAHATDRNTIIEVLANGFGRPIYSTYSQSSWAYTPDVEHYDFDPQRAAALLREAGYVPDARGRLMRDGQPLRLKVLYNSPNTIREGIALFTQFQLERLGISVDARGLEFQTYLDALKSPPYDYDLFVLGWNATVEPQFMSQVWSEQQIPSLNSGAYVNKQVESLYEAAGREFDRERRRTIYHQIQRILADDLPYVFLYEGRQLAAVSKRVRGIVPTRRGLTYNMHQWYLDDEAG